jgi:hypothetical protein
MWGLPLGITCNAVELMRKGIDDFIPIFFPLGVFMLFGFFVGGRLFAAYEWNSYQRKSDEESSDDY